MGRVEVQVSASKIPVQAMRRSTRLRAELDVRLRSLDPAIPFEDNCRTLIVNAQGGGLQCSRELPPDTIVMLAIGSRETTGKVLNSTRVGSGNDTWVVGVELHEQGNFWGVPSPPADWLVPTEDAPASVAPAAAPAAETATKSWPFARKKREQKPTLMSSPAFPSHSAPASEVQREQLAGELEKVRADLERKTATEWEQWRTKAQADLLAIQSELRRGIGDDAVRWQKQATRAEERLAELLRSCEEIQSRVQTTSRDTVEQLAAGRQQLIAELKNLAGDVQRSAAEAQARLAEAARVKQEEIAAVHAAPVQAQPSFDAEQLRAAVEQYSNASQEAMAKELAAGLEQLRQQLQFMTGERDEELRRRFLADFEARESGFLATIEKRLQELNSAEAATRTFAEKMSAEALRQAEQSMAGLRSQVEEMIARHESELASRLSVQRVEGIKQTGSYGEGLVKDLDQHAEERKRELMDAAEKALHSIDERQQDVARREAELAAAADAALERMDQRRAQIEAASSAAIEKLDKHTAESLVSYQSSLEERQKELDTALEQRAWDYEAQAEVARERLEEKVTTALQRLDSEIQQKQAQLSGMAEEVLRNAQAKTEGTLRAGIAEDHDRQLKSIQQRLDAEHEQRRQELQAKTGEIASAMKDLQAQQEQLKAQLEEVQRSRSYLETLAADLPATMASHAQKHAADAWQDLQARSEQHVMETLKRESSREAEQLTATLRSAADQLQQELAAQAQSTAAGLQARLAELIAEREQQLDSRAAAAVVQHSGNLLERLEARTDEIVRQQLARAEEQIQAKAAAAASDAVRSGEELRQLVARTDVQSRDLQKQLEDARTWLASESDAFQKTVHDSFLKAGGEIRGRAASAIEMADEFMQQKSKDAIAQVENAATHRAAQFARQAEEAEAHLKQLEQAAGASANELLQARLAETLESFRQDAARLAESAAARWQAAMGETLRAIPGLLQNNLSEESKSGGGSAGK